MNNIKSLYRKIDIWLLLDVGWVMIPQIT